MQLYKLQTYSGTYTYSMYKAYVAFNAGIDLIQSLVPVHVHIHTLHDPRFIGEGVDILMTGVNLRPGMINSVFSTSDIFRDFSTVSRSQRKQIIFKSLLSLNRPTHFNGSINLQILLFYQHQQHV